MIDALPLLLGPEGYQISRSVRLRSSASAYFTRTPASASNRRTWTWSGWVKRGSLGANQVLMSSDVGTSVNTWAEIGFTSADALQVTSYSGQRNTTAIYRDPSAWYHIVVAFDTTQAVEVDRVKFYVNGVLNAQTGDAGFPAQNTDYGINNNQAHSIGQRNWASGVGRYFDGYLTEVNFIDGQALTPSSFGENDTITGVWKPKKYAGTYGTNGFYLNFSDNSAATAAAIGKDYSGNGNNWTPNNISVTAGVTYDSMIDVPTLWADGGNGRGNYAVLNPLDQVGGRALTTSNGNLNFTGTYGESKSSIQLPESGKYYFEYVWTAIASTPAQLIAGIAGYQSDGQKSTGGAWSAYGASWTTNDVIGAAVDMDAKTVTFYKNGTSQGSISSPSYSNRDILTTSNGSAATNSGYANFGQRPFAYTPPSGFKALNTQNLPDSTILAGNKYMDATTFTGNASTQSIVNSGGMQPDLVWLKSRSNANNHTIYDVLRGVDNILYPNLTNAAVAGSGNLTAFNSNGFTLGASENSNDNSGESSVGWQWKKGATQGFDIVTFTFSTAGTNTINHSLGVAPKLIIMKDRSFAYNWDVYHASVGYTQRLILNSTAAAGAGFWAAAPTSTQFSVTNTAYNNNDLVVAYLFSEVAGFSRMGSFQGNGSTDGSFVYLGFRPRWLMIKRTDTADDWVIIDTSRMTYNVAGSALFPNSASAETTNGWYNIDVTSNGFKARASNTPINASGGTYIYAAFAENPFKNALAR